MKDITINLVLDHAMEIVAPNRGKVGDQCSVVCLCCEGADQPMDDDGCGICDGCLGLPARASDDLGALDFPAPSPHLSVTTRNR